MTRKQIWSVIRKLDYTLDDNTMETMTDDIYNKILTNTYDFSGLSSFLCKFLKKIYGEGNLPLCIASDFIELLY